MDLQQKNMHKQLFDHLGTIVPLSESLKNALSQLLFTKEFKKRTCLLVNAQLLAARS